MYLAVLVGVVSYISVLSFALSGLGWLVWVCLRLGGVGVFDFGLDSGIWLQVGLALWFGCC